MSTNFRPLEIPPGVVAKPTKQMRSSNWSEVNLVRWREGQLMPVGGQQQYQYQFASRCRAIHGWYGLDGVYRVAYLCETNLYVDVGGLLSDTIEDITPPSGITPPTVITEGGYGSGYYNDQTYGTPRDFTSEPPPEYTQQALDTLPDAWSLDNFGAILLAMSSPDGRLLQWNPANGSPGVVATLAATAAFTATSTTIPMVANPGTVTPGMNVFDTTSGQQIGTVLTYPSGGTTLTLTAAAAHASSGAADHLQFGNVAMPVVAQSGRGIVPTGRCFEVTPERFVKIFGALDATNGGGFRRFAWCDQENFQAWDYSSVTSQAGYLDIEPASPIVTAISTRNGTLFWTGKKAYVSQFLGLPYVYNYVELADNCTPWSPSSIVTTSLLALWMSEQGAFSFDGTSILPVACMVRPWIDDDIDAINVRNQACAVHAERFNEFWWFYPANGQPYNTKVVIYSYKEGWWSQGLMARSAGITSSYTVDTIMTDGEIAYVHELGVAYSPDAPLPWAETFDLNLNSGARLTTVKQLIPDVEGDVNNLLYSLFYRRSRSVQNGQPVVELQTTPIPVRPDGFVDFRATGRDIRLRIELANMPVNPVTLGQHLIDAAPRGNR